MTMPVQKPGQSKQDYQTPPALLAAVKSRLQIPDFTIDLAASLDNRTTFMYYDESQDSLNPDLTWNPVPGGWAWLNPPYANIRPWAEKAAREAQKGAHIVMLVPSSVGSDWWRDWVEAYAYQSHLNGRVTFVGCVQGYPKDCSILLYTPWQYMGHEIWDWRGSVPELRESGLSESEGLPSVLEV